MIYLFENRHRLVTRRIDGHHDTSTNDMCSVTKHHFLIGIPDEMIETRIMVSISWTVRSPGPVMRTSYRHLMFETSW